MRRKKGGFRPSQLMQLQEQGVLKSIPAMVGVVCGTHDAEGNPSEWGSSLL